MTPKEKAKELVYSFAFGVDLPSSCNYPTIGEEAAKQCALICVEEILKVVPQKKEWSKETLMQMEAMLDNPDDYEKPNSELYTYFQSVKSEIEKL